MVFMLCSLEPLWGVARQGSGQAPYSPPSLLFILHGLAKPSCVRGGEDPWRMGGPHPTAQVALSGGGAI